jgi:hypothetical protein
MVGARPTRPKARRERQRDTFYPGAADYIYPQLREEGWGRIPRNLPLILAIIDAVKAQNPKQKGLDVTRTYLDLFANNLGEGVVEVKNEQDFAFRAGFTSNDRGMRSWKERLAVLEELGFIKMHHAASKRIDFILMVHPRKVVKHLHRVQRLEDGPLWDAFLQSLADFEPHFTEPDEPLVEDDAAMVKRVFG